jgi:hypothetical protein
MATVDASRANVVFARAEAGGLSLFPSESSPGVSFSQQEVLAQSARYAPLYAELSAAIASALTRERGMPPAAAAVLTRKAVVPLTHCFFDRLLRLHRLLEGRRGDPPAVAQAPSFAAPALVEDLQALAVGSDAFNAWVLSRLAPVWELPAVPAPAAAAADPAPAAAPFVNRNFGGATLLGKLRKRLARKLGWGRVPALSMAYDTDPLMENGLYGPGRLADLYRPSPPPAVPPDAALREAALAGPAGLCAPALRAFLAASGVGDAVVQGRALAAFSAFLRDAFPTGLLESAAPELAAARERLAPYAGRWLLLEGAGDHFSVMMVAAAKTLGIKVAGCQHGGIYGHLLDIASVNELEYPFYDRFLTWGWTRLPEHPAYRGLTAEPLPNPWLSERRRLWRERPPLPPSAAPDKPYGFLLMTNKVYPFTPAPAGADVARVDRLADFAAALKDLAAAAARRGEAILNKPYAGATVGLLRGTYSELESSPAFRVAATRDKGLTKELVDQCRMVLWDQPASGFIECLASGIPTMVHWSRFYNREVAWAEPCFSELEAVGLVHRGVETLFDELARFRSTPEAWMAEPRRAAAVARFLGEYGLTDERWTQRWKDYLRGLR